MVSEAFFKKLEKIIDSSKSNIVLHIYYWVMNYELWIMNYELWIMNYGF
jgi:hypothetical protein